VAEIVRDAGATKLRILAAARVEFADHGYMGARVDRIARTARANKRLLDLYSEIDGGVIQ